MKKDDIHYYDGDDLGIECKIVQDKYDTTIFNKNSHEAQWNGLTITPELAKLMVNTLQDYLKDI